MEISLRALARLYKRPKNVAKSWIDQGLPYRKTPGGHYRIDVFEAIDWIDEHVIY